MKGAGNIYIGKSSNVGLGVYFFSKTFCFLWCLDPLFVLTLLWRVRRVYLATKEMDVQPSFWNEVFGSNLTQFIYLKEVALDDIIGCKLSGFFHGIPGKMGWSHIRNGLFGHERVDWCCPPLILFSEHQRYQISSSMKKYVYIYIYTRLKLGVAFIQTQPHYIYCIETYLA